MQAKTVPSGDQVAEAKRQRPRRVRHTAAQWAQIIAAQRQSPLTLVEFCRRRQIALATFRYWRQHLASPTAVALPTQRFPPVPLVAADALLCVRLHYVAADGAQAANQLIDLTFAENRHWCSRFIGRADRLRSRFPRTRGPV